jgi:hypothetical protein
MPMRVLSACFVVAFATLAACSPSAHEQELADAREQWSRQLPRSYELTWQQDCFCTPDMVRPIRIRVAAGQITSATFVDDREEVTESIRGRLATVDGVFDRIEDALEEGADQIDVEYDATWGYPESLYVDYSRRTADEELTLQLSDFAPIER